MEEPIPNALEQISDADWAKTPVSVRQVIEVLSKRVEQLGSDTPFDPTIWDRTGWANSKLSRIEQKEGTAPRH